MGNILLFSDYVRAIDNEGANHIADSDRDSFLLEEGLDLLASYRAIQDRGMRFKVKALVEMIAKNQHGEG